MCESGTQWGDGGITVQLMAENKVAFDVKQTKVPEVVGNVAAVLPRGKENAKPTKNEV